MHGRKRTEYKAHLRDTKIAAALSQKAQQWYALRQELSRRRDNEPESDRVTTLKLMEKALLVNPDPLSLWNHRREIILLEIEANKNETDEIILNEELALTQAALKRNPKAYAAWFHRKWILALLKPGSDILQNELKLTAQFFALDERNFHCWNYRRFVISATANCWNGGWTLPEMGPQIGGNTTTTTTTTTTSTCAIIPDDILKSEWNFTQQKIQDNFSNFSAFHYRSQLLPHILKQQQEDEGIEQQEDLLGQEMQLIEDAICTEPDDQTAWWYHKLLLVEYKFPPSRLEEQAELFRELKEDSPGKWVSLGLYEILSILDGSKEEKMDLLKELIDIDSDRANRYKELLQILIG